MTDFIGDALSQIYKVLLDGEDVTLPELFVQTLTTEQAAMLAIAARQKRLDMEKEFERMVAPLTATQELIERRFLAEMNATGETNKSGTGWRATKTTQQNASMPDAGAFYAWLAQSARYDMLQRRLSSSVVADYFKETGTLPPGLTLQPVNKVTFYRK